MKRPLFGDSEVKYVHTRVGPSKNHWFSWYNPTISKQRIAFQRCYLFGSIDAHVEYFVSPLLSDLVVADDLGINAYPDDDIFDSCFLRAMIEAAYGYHRTDLVGGNADYLGTFFFALLIESKVWGKLLPFLDFNEGSEESKSFRIKLWNDWVNANTEFRIVSNSGIIENYSLFSVGDTPEIILSRLSGNWLYFDYGPSPNGGVDYSFSLATYDFAFSPIIPIYFPRCSKNWSELQKYVDDSKLEWNKMRDDEIAKAFGVNRIIALGNTLARGVENTAPQEVVVQTDALIGSRNMDLINMVPKKRTSTKTSAKNNQ
jgi:hypothetical protein